MATVGSSLNGYWAVCEELFDPGSYEALATALGSYAEPKQKRTSMFLLLYMYICIYVYTYVYMWPTRPYPTLLADAAWRESFVSWWHYEPGVLYPKSRRLLWLNPFLADSGGGALRVIKPWSLLGGLALGALLLVQEEGLLEGSDPQP